MPERSNLSPNLALLYHVYCHIGPSNSGRIPKLKHWGVSLFYIKITCVPKFTHSYQEKASNSYLRVTRFDIRRNRHRKILGEKSPIQHGIIRTIEQNGTQARGRTAWRKSSHRAWRDTYDQSGLYCRLNEDLSVDPELLLISEVSKGKYAGPRTFLMTWIVSCWPGDTSCPCVGNPMVMPCAAAATAQMEATRMDNNFIFWEKNVWGVFGGRFLLVVQ